MKRENIFYLFIGLFILWDIGYSFVQYYGETLDGDMADIILPSPRCEEVLADPFGWSIISEQKKYVGPNRYFAHQLMSSYFKNVPLLLQNVTDPVNSVYLSCAIFKALTHLLLLGMLTLYCCSILKLKENNWIFILALLVPFFQAYGYNRSLGLVMHSTTYTFFYSFPIGLLLLFFWPFWKKVQDMNYRISSIQLILSFVLIVLLSFNGPLINPLVLIICPAILLYQSYKDFDPKSKNGFFERAATSLRNIPTSIVIPLLVFILLSAYSFYIGTYNSEETVSKSLLERYGQLPAAFYYQLTRKLGFPLLILFLMINTIFLRKYKKNNVAHNLLWLWKWIGLFSLIYIFLLPFGGYRPYRPNILRTDTILPITICLFFFFASSTAFLIQQFQQKQKQVYIASILALLIIFTIADEPNFHKNECERGVLQRLSKTKEDIVNVDPNCTVLSWNISKRKNSSKYRGMLLKEWKITEEAKLWRQEGK